MKTRPPAMSIMYLMWITSIPLLIIKTSCKTSDITLPIPCLIALRNTQLDGGFIGVSLLMWAKAFDLKGSHFSVKSTSERKHYVKCNYKTLLLAQDRVEKNSPSVAKCIKFVLRENLMVCELMRKIKPLAWLAMMHSGSHGFCLPCWHNSVTA